MKDKNKILLFIFLSSVIYYIFGVVTGFICAWIILGALWH
jgi:hypothetical protein